MRSADSADDSIVIADDDAVTLGNDEAIDDPPVTPLSKSSITKRSLFRFSIQVEPRVAIPLFAPRAKNRRSVQLIPRSATCPTGDHLFLGQLNSPNFDRARMAMCKDIGFGENRSTFSIELQITKRSQEVLNFRCGGILIPSLDPQERTAGLR